MPKRSFKELFELVSHENLAQREGNSEDQYDHGFESQSTVTQTNPRDHAWTPVQHDNSHQKEFNTQTQKQTNGAYNAFMQ